MTITISLPPEVEEALKSVGKKSRRDEMFIDKSQPSRTVAHLWATEQPFRSSRRLEYELAPLITINISPLRGFFRRTPCC